MKTNIQVPKEIEHIKPYLDLMQNAVSGIVGNSYNMTDLIRLALDKSVIIGDSEGIDEIENEGVTLIPATENLPKGKYINLSPLRKSMQQLYNVKMSDIITFINDYNFERNVSENELIELIINNFKKEEIN